MKFVDSSFANMGYYSSRFDGSMSDNPVERIKRMMYRNGKMKLSDEEALRIVEQLELQGLSILDVKKVIFDRDYDRVGQGIIKILSRLKPCLKKYEIKVEMIHASLPLIPAEIKNSSSSSSSSSNNKKNKNSKKRKKLKETMMKVRAMFEGFKLADDPFADFNCHELKLLTDELQMIMPGLIQKKHYAQERLRSTKRWRKVLNAFYTVIFDVTLGISVVLASILASPVVAMAATSAAAAVMKSLEPWVNSLWDKHEKALAGEIEALETMCEAELEVHELESIRLLAEKLKTGLDSMSNCVDFAIRGGNDAVKIAAHDISNKVGELDEMVKNLKEKINARVVGLENASPDGFLKIILR